MAKVCRVDQALDRIAERATAPMSAAPGASSTHDAPHSSTSPALSAADELWLLEASERSIVAITDVMGSNDARTMLRARRKAANGPGRNGYVHLTVTGTLSQTLSEGETVRVFDGANELGSATVRGRAWTFQDARSLSGGQVVSYAVHVADATGNLCPTASVYMMTIEPVDAPRRAAVPATTRTDPGAEARR